MSKYWMSGSSWKSSLEKFFSFLLVPGSQNCWNSAAEKQFQTQTCCVEFRREVSDVVFLLRPQYSSVHSRNVRLFCSGKKYEDFVKRFIFLRCRQPILLKYQGDCEYVLILFMYVSKFGAVLWVLVSRFQCQFPLYQCSLPTPWLMAAWNNLGLRCSFCKLSLGPALLGRWEVDWRQVGTCPEGWTAQTIDQCWRHCSWRFCRWTCWCCWIRDRGAGVLRRRKSRQNKSQNVQLKPTLQHKAAGLCTKYIPGIASEDFASGSWHLLAKVDLEEGVCVDKTMLNQPF